MSYFTIADARRAGRSRAVRESGTAGMLLREAAAAPTVRFDIFLSHSLRDAEVVLGVKTILEQVGLSVYVDWIVDPQLDRDRISAATAQQLRIRMIQCSSLIYVATAAATESKWMPWELGYFDGRRSAEAVAILPLVEYQGQYIGQEYLGLYPEIENDAVSSLLPVVRRRNGARIEKKSLADLALARGGAAWRT